MNTNVRWKKIQRFAEMQGGLITHCWRTRHHLRPRFNFSLPKRSTNDSMEFGNKSSFKAVCLGHTVMQRDWVWEPSHREYKEEISQDDQPIGDGKKDTITAPTKAISMGMVPMSLCFGFLLLFVFVLHYYWKKDFLHKLFKTWRTLGMEQ